MKFSKLGKFLIPAALSALLALSAGAQFSKTNTYSGQFTDVKADAWYANEVKSAYELGFMNGTSDTQFSPAGKVTVGQGITMAARINALANGKEVPANSTSGKWYDNAVKYALENGIIAEGDFDSYDRNIKRHEMAELVYNSMTPGDFPAQNVVYSIPDVSNAADYTQKLLTLYNAGIVMGSDEYGSFNPDSDIVRSECAAIINRVALPENRLKKDLKKSSSKDAYLLCYNESFSGYKEGISSGWVLDNRGGAPRNSIYSDYSVLADVSDEYGSAMIREFNEIYNGTIVVETTYTFSDNGFYIEFRDNKDKTTYQIRAMENSWQILGKDGKYTTLATGLFKESSSELAKVRLYIDLDSGKSTTYINNVNLGTHDLLSDNVLNYRFATGDKERLTVSPGLTNMVVNYKVYEEFEVFDANAVYGWEISDNVKVASKVLWLEENATAKKTFSKANGTVSAQNYFILPKAGTYSYTLKSGNADVVNFEAKDGKFYANGKEMYTYTKNMWYRLRVNVDLNAKKADILLNGRSIGEVELYSNGAIDNFVVKTGAGTQARLDDIKIYETYNHDDYVPEPTVKANLDDYVVGLNICSLWKNGEHWGWACITPYDEPKPVLGYYDEGTPESADWEIKYMVEHGIDFQAFCWYADNANAPIKEPRNGDQLHEGYMYAKYSDYMKYTIIWEAANSAHFKADAFREHVIPFWFENYFLDDRYLKLDNKIVICLFGADKLYGDTYFGSIANAKKELEYLEEVAKSYGFDGVIFLSGNGDSNAAAQMGMDGKYAYNWGTAGNTYEANVNGIRDSAKVKGIYTVPTISVGFDSIPWHSKRYGNISLEDYKRVIDWVNNSYLPVNAEAGTWQDKLVMISTWNEYGEGTYISPAGLNGFGYLDCLREAYTNYDKAHTDIYPTAKQTERFNHLYAQYARLLRDEGWYTRSGDDETKLETVHEIKFDKTSISFFGVDSSTVKYTDEGASATTNHNDPGLRTNDRELNYDLTGITHIKVTMKAPASNQVEVFFTTQESSKESQDKSISFNTDTDEMKTYLIRVQNSQFKGNLMSIRIDPTNKTGVPVTLQKIEFLRVNPDLVRDLYINNEKVQNLIEPATAENGAVVHAFDPGVGTAYAMNVHHTWRKGQGTLKIEGNNHVVEFTVGSDKYKVDGVTKDLGYRLFTLDGLPMMDYKVLSEALGYKYEFKDGDDYVQSNQYKTYESMQSRVVGSWEFNDYDTESWASTHFAMMVNDGTLTLTSLSDTNFDPITNYKADIELYAPKYMAFEIKCRYKYTNKDGTSNTNQGFTMYYTTDKDSSWNETKTIKAKLPDEGTTGEWQILRVDLTANSAWKDTIMQLRFDPFNAVGYMEIDYMRFIEDPDYVYVDPTTLPFTITNGDAENTGDAAAFYSNNATISIIKDPAKEGNHVYMVTTKPLKQWTYFRQGGNFKEGKKYTISYDICLVSDGLGADPGEVVFNTNLRYADIGALNDYDHIVNSVKVKKGEWVHVETEYIVTKVDSKANHEFAIYANPVGDVGTNYMVDNIVVVESDAPAAEKAA